ncbi:hypothetical protein E4U42_000706 [Claviceps africana]|uniref:Peptidase M3A/M3B catalytic domain-containing protein n=1 Tax=Claviceps africana TaxID=83212 RepID=A0A8K0JA60_9HYPO|nr:hypothetical protein E4U42_000706 [Claviceps africana]
MTQCHPPPLKFNLTPSQIAALAKQLVQKAHDGIQYLTSSVDDPHQATFDNTLLPLSHIENEISYEIEAIVLLENVSPSAEVRTAASNAFKSVQEALRSIYNSDAFFALVDAVVKKQGSLDLDEESERLLSDTHVAYIHMGLKLPADQRRRFEQMMERKAELRALFVQTLGADPGSLWVHEHELDGMSRAALEGLEQDENGRRRISLYASTTNKVLTQCSNEETRRKVFLAKERTHADNAPLFHEIVLLRDESARMLGYLSYNHQLVSRRMMKSPEAVMDLLHDLSTKLSPLVESEMKALQDLRPDGGSIHFWDFFYYDDKMLQARNVSGELISEYFPADFVLRRMLDIFEKLFRLEIVELLERGDDEVWHPDVKVFTVKDLVDASFVGHLYMDLYPREGKYNHAADFSVRPSYMDKKGEYAPSATALICNVTPPTKDTPALLTHSDVITIFHELGHGMHDLMGRTKYAKYHGWRGRRDFVEAPSQLLEFWCWLPETLKSMSCHYSHLSEQYKHHWRRMHPHSRQDPEKQMPDAMVSTLLAAKRVNEGIKTARQVALSLFDMKIHHPSCHEELEKMDMAKEYYHSITRVSGLQGLADGGAVGNGHCTTPHFIWGQEANYYSYLSTRMLAADMWKTCFAKDAMSPEAGLRYRRMVLDKGGSVDEATMVAAFLGREPDAKAYLEEMGVSFL